MDADEALDRRIGRADVVRQVFEELPLILGAVHGEQHRYIASNAAHRAFLKKSDFVGKTMLEVNPEWRDQEVQHLMDLAFRTGTVQRVREWHIQVANPDDGTLREAYVNSTLAPRINANGDVEGINSFTLDVTELVQARTQADERAFLAEERFRRSSHDVGVLQRALLPAGLPVLPEVDLGAAYLLAQQEAAAGGDWFDAFRVPDGRVALVVGDVVGNGVAASAVMGQLRAVLHERLVAGESIAEGVAAADRMAARIPGGRATTVCVALLDTITGVLEYCAAGHQPPLVVAADGSAHHLPPSGGVPLGSGGGPRLTCEAVIGPGGVLMLYSDGLLERPGRDPVVSMREIEAIAGQMMQPVAAFGALAERLSQAMIELLVKGTGHSDDITVLACHRETPPPPLEIIAPATAQSVPGIRSTLREWLRGARVPEQMQQLMLHASGELVSNTVVHAYRDLPSAALADDAIRLRADLSPDGVLEIEVLDRGQWREPNLDKYRVHGLDMATDLADSILVSGDAEGTRACLGLRLTRAARIMDAPQLESVTDHVSGTDTLLIMRRLGEETIGLVLDGPLDLTTTEALRQECQRALFHQLKILEIDLTRVTLLASAGVATLYRLRDECAEGDIHLRLIAPDRTTPAYVLDLVNLPREAAPG